MCEVNDTRFWALDERRMEPDITAGASQVSHRDRGFEGCHGSTPGELCPVSPHFAAPMGQATRMLTEMGPWEASVDQVRH